MRILRKPLWLFLILTIGSLSGCQKEASVELDLVLSNGKIWTGDQSNEWASWIAIKGEEIVAVGSESDPLPQAKESIDLDGRLTVPGFNDSHVHFASAGALLLGINLLEINDEVGLQKEIKAATSRLPKGSWITQGDWGAYEAWSAGSDGSSRDDQIFVPHRDMIDGLTPDHPVLIRRYDRTQGLANELALVELGIESRSGLLKGEQLEEALSKIPEKSFERRVAETQRGLEECRKYGVTTVQDMSPLDQVDVYNHIKEKGELTCRINFAPSRLIEHSNMAQKGWVIDSDNPDGARPSGDKWISFGTLKTHIDGIMGGRSARFYEPYSDNDPDFAGWRGGWREFSEDLPNFKEMILAADKAGIQLRIHAIGDEANAILLDIVDTLQVVNGEKERRFRIVHAQVIGDRDLPRFKGKNIVAEVQPYHVTDDMRWMEERIGHERCKGAYAFKSLEENGCILSFGSDWPGTNASYYPINPLWGLYAAVTRQTIEGKPEEGWFPEQRIELEQALRAYTWGSSFGAFEEGLKGTIEKEKLADITVIKTDLFETEPKAWLDAEIAYTIVGGKVVFDGINDASKTSSN